MVGGGPVVCVFVCGGLCVSGSRPKGKQGGWRLATGLWVGGREGGGCGQRELSWENKVVGGRPGRRPGRRPALAGREPPRKIYCRGRRELARDCARSAGQCDIGNVVFFSAMPGKAVLGGGKCGNFSRRRPRVGRTGKGQAKKRGEGDKFF